MGIHNRSCLKLASPDLAITHAGRSALWIRTAMAPSDESLIPHCKYVIALFCPSSDDESPLEERLCCRPVRFAPSSRGVCCLGGRAQGRPFRVLLDADHGSVLRLC